MSAGTKYRTATLASLSRNNAASVTNAYWHSSHRGVMKMGDAADDLYEHEMVQDIFKSWHDDKICERYPACPYCTEPIPIQPQGVSGE